MKSQIAKTMRTLIQDESAQGATEYILLLVVVVGIMFAFKDNIVKMVSAKVINVGNSISGFDAK